MTAAATPQASIIIPTYNEGAWLRRTVEAVREVTRLEPYEVLVVDDGSTDGSSAFLADQDWQRRSVRCLRGERRGVAGARALGAERARGRALIFLDAHVIPDAGWLTDIMTLLQDPGVGLAAPTVRALNDLNCLGHKYFPVNPNLEAGWMPPNGTTVQESPAVTGCCFGIRRSTYWAIGGIDPGSTGWGVNDIELGLRTWYTGYRCLVSGRSQVAHRFKSGEDRGFKVSWEDYDVNLLRTAFTYFAGPRLSGILLNAAGRPSFQRSLRRVQADRAYWRRRQRLQRGFVSDEHWLFERFRPELAPLDQRLFQLRKERGGRGPMRIQREVACPACGAKNLGTQETCLICHAELPTPAAALKASAGSAEADRCAHCSQVIPPGVRYCTHCGQPVPGR